MDSIPQPGSGQPQAARRSAAPAKGVPGELRALLQGAARHLRQDAGRLLPAEDGRAGRSGPGHLPVAPAAATVRRSTTMEPFLGSFLYSPWMLVGLAVLAIPPIIHLLNRRRYDVVDWGAMQFLKISEVTRRRLLLEEILLMLLRMGLLGVLVFALAGPFFSTSLPARLGAPTNRHAALRFGGPYRMAAG